MVKVVEFGLLIFDLVVVPFDVVTIFQFNTWKYKKMSSIKIRFVVFRRGYRTAKSKLTYLRFRSFNVLI